MSAGLVWSNVLAYTLQVGLLTGLGALVPAALRIRTPRVRLLYWQMLLAACLALPWIRSWRQEVVSGALQVSDIVATLAVASAPVRQAIPLPPLAQIALWFLAAGVAIRLGWLGAGLARLASYRRRGRTMRTPPGIGGTVLLLSDDVASPVTFGWRDPVVLLPVRFPALPEEMQEAILCHELLHVARRDWLFAIGEELVRAVLWFHPAIWWVIGEIQLAREQTVDQAVIETTQAREPYVDALLLMAGAAVDLAPAPMFLRKRHLKKRLMDVMKEVGMATISRTRFFGVMGLALVILAAACWLATGAFPLAAAPQVVDDSAGVAVNMNGSQLMHRSSVPYPAEAVAKGIEGTVVVQVKLDANGEVSDATVLSGPDELRRGVLQSVLTWHFDKSAALTTRTVNIDFVKPAAAAVHEPATANPPRMAPAPPPPPPPPTSGKLDRIVVTGLSDEARGELLSRLPIQEGGEWTGQMFAAVKASVQEFDSHLTTRLTMPAAGTLELRIDLANSALSAVRTVSPVSAGVPVVLPPLPPGVYSVGNGTMPPAVVSKVDPAYTEEARAAKLSGSVFLTVVVGTDGKADDVQVVRSLGMGLDENAVACVQQWVFKPGMNQGVPVKVRAQIEVNFRLL